MRIHACDFCGAPVYPGHGMMFVRNDCKAFRFCRGKCRKAFDRRRNPRKVRWTKTFRKAHGKEMSVDSAFEFEKKRNIPVKYDRNLVGTALRAMRRVEEISQRRAQRFHEARMKGKVAIQRLQDQREIAQHGHIVPEAEREAIMAGAAAPTTPFNRQKRLQKQLAAEGRLPAESKKRVHPLAKTVGEAAAAAGGGGGDAEMADPFAVDPFAGVTAEAGAVDVVLEAAAEPQRRRRAKAGKKKATAAAGAAMEDE